MSDGPSTRRTAPGDGERRAVRGLVAQYRLAARLIYDQIASGSLLWIGLADRTAGGFDDIVLGLTGGVTALQVKTSRAPAAFRLRTLLLGSDAIWSAMLDSRERLAVHHPGAIIDMVYVCDDFPSTTDRLGASSATSSAGFLDRFRQSGRQLSREDWAASEFAAFILELQNSSGLDDSAFLEVWRSTSFVTGGEGRAPASAEQTRADTRRIDALSALLPVLIANAGDRDKWSLADLQAKLGWADTLTLRHSHAFPISPLHEPHAPAVAALQAILDRHDQGYLSVTGPPGSGKSTLLASGLETTVEARVSRYLAFVPGAGQNLGRGETYDFLHDIVRQLRRHGLGAAMIPGETADELRLQLQTLMLEAGARFSESRVRTLLVVDGLDHVPREERPQFSFLRALPPPESLPRGMVIVLGSQRLDLDDVPLAVQRQAGEAGRTLRTPPLTREAVSALAAAANLPPDVDRAELYARCAGHPLSTRYAIKALAACEGEEARSRWITDGPAYGDDVEPFYASAWEALRGDADARSILAYVSLSEAPLRPALLDRLASSAAVDAAWEATRHLLTRDASGGWSVFHNSFRLFLHTVVGLRHDLPDPEAVRLRYHALAEATAAAGTTDPQRWMALRYLARAEDQVSVARLARPERFRQQFIEGRDPGDIDDDIGLAFQAAGTTRSLDLLVELVLVRHELDSRAEALGDSLFDAYLDLDDLEAARTLLNARGVALSTDRPFRLIDLDLAAGRGDEARALFEDVEPLDILLGSEPPAFGAEEDLDDWAERVLAFRTPGQVVAALSRLVPPDDPLDRPTDMDGWRRTLKRRAIEGELWRRPDLDLQGLMRELSLAVSESSSLGLTAALAAEKSGAKDLALARLSSLRVEIDGLGESDRREGAGIAARLRDPDLARTFLEGVAPPDLCWTAGAGHGDEDLRRGVVTIFNHANLRARLGLSQDIAAEPASTLMARLQTHVTRLGAAAGRAHAGVAEAENPLRLLTSVIDFVAQAEGTGPHDFLYWRHVRAIDTVIEAVVRTAKAVGGPVPAACLAQIDGRLDQDWRLGQAHVRRAYAIAAFAIDQDPDRARSRMAYTQGTERTPEGQLQEGSAAARALKSFGLVAEAREHLAGLHREGLGFARPAKKDGQYHAWTRLLERANEADPSGRFDRLAFMAKLLHGMSETEGSDIASRVAPFVLSEAARTTPAWVIALADRIEASRLATWPVLVHALAEGAALAAPELAYAAVVVTGGLAVPYVHERDAELFDRMISVAPQDQLEAVVKAALTSIEIGAQDDDRVLGLEAVRNAAAARGATLGDVQIRRWQAELPPPSSRSSPEDPFFQTRSLEEVASLLSASASSPWKATKAFVRLAPRHSYEEARDFCRTWEDVASDPRALEVMGDMAIAADRREEAKGFLNRLKTLSEGQAEWSAGWSTAAALAAHRLADRLEGAPARRRAFDRLVNDLAHGRQGASSLLMNLGEVLEGLDPPPDWALTWRLLENHLSQFREYALGDELSLAAGGQEPEAAAEAIADILFRAVDAAAADLIGQMRLAVERLCAHPASGAVVGALLRRLVDAGGNHRLEALQLSWTNRSAGCVRETLTDRLQDLAADPDLAVRTLAAALADHWDVRVEVLERPLPAFYNLAFARDPRANRFRRPSGLDETNEGLFTSDPWSWTWPLRAPLEIAAEASGRDIQSLRLRAARLMEADGVERFSPDALRELKSRYIRLDLEMAWNRPGVQAAFLAMRKVLGELAAADEIDPRALGPVLWLAGADGRLAVNRHSIAHPTGFVRPRLPDLYKDEDRSAWCDQVSDDLQPPAWEDGEILGAWGRHDRASERYPVGASQFFGATLAASSLAATLDTLPMVDLRDDVSTFYDAPSPSGLAVARGPSSWGEDVRALILCPRLAEALGWEPDPQDAFTFRDAEGKRRATTLRWRDGVASSRFRSVKRAGCFVSLDSEAMQLVQPWLTTSPDAAAWRRAGSIVRMRPEHDQGRLEPRYNED